MTTQYVVNKVIKSLELKRASVLYAHVHMYNASEGAVQY